MIYSELNELRELYNVISRSWYHVQRIYVLINKFGSCDQKCCRYDENFIGFLLLCLLLNISLSTLFSTEKSHVFHQREGFKIQDNYI